MFLGSMKYLVQWIELRERNNMNPVLEDYYKAREFHDACLGDLEKETTRIVQVIKKIFKCKNAWWSYQYYHDSDDDPPLPDKIDKDAKYGDSFPIHISEECDSGKWYYNEAIPVKFFDMSDIEIEEYIKNEIKEYEEEEMREKEEKKKKLEEKNKKKNALIEKAKSKLSQEEKKALGI